MKSLYFFICILHRIVNIFYNSCSSKTTTVHGAPLETVIRLMHIHSMPHKNCIPQHSKLHDRNLNMFTNEIHLPMNISYFFLCHGIFSTAMKSRETKTKLLCASGNSLDLGDDPIANERCQSNFYLQHLYT